MSKRDVDDNVVEAVEFLDDFETNKDVEDGESEASLEKRYNAFNGSPSSLISNTVVSFYRAEMNISEV